MCYTTNYLGLMTSPIIPGQAEVGPKLLIVHTAKYLHTYSFWFVLFMSTLCVNFVLLVYLKHKLILGGVSVQDITFKYLI